MAKKWYVLHTYSGYENKVKKNLETRIETMGLENSVFAIEIPTETVTEIKEGGRDYEVTVEFDSAGVRKMFAMFAKLVKL